MTAYEDMEISKDLARQMEPARPFGLPDVPFGPRDDDRIPFTWAERGLTWLHEQRPAVFADMMLEITGVGKKPRGSK